MKRLKTHMDDDAHFRLKMAAHIKRMTLTKWARMVLEREAARIIEEHERHASPPTTDSATTALQHHP